MRSSTGSRLAFTARRVLTAALVGAAITACGGDDPATGPGALASIVVTPTATLAINATQQFVAVGKDASGTVVPFSPTWSIEKAGGAINATGMFTAGTAPGV